MAANVTTQWNHAVPLGHENHRPRAASASSRGANYSHQDSSNYAYGGVSKRPSNTNMRGDNEGQRSRNNSIPRKRSAKPLRQQQTAPEEPDEGWIHRDKLREIEIQEMEQAGMRIRQPRRSGSTGPGASQRSNSRSMSRNGLRRPMSREQMGESPVDDSGYADFKRKRVSTIPAADASEEREAEFHHQNDSELRTLEELAAPQPGYRQHSGRPSTSRIPISKVSPMPVPNAMVDRDSPLPRSRHGSTNWSGNWDDLQYARQRRSGSVGSQVLLDDDGYRTPSRPASSHVRRSADDRNGTGSTSPPKARMPNKDNPTSGGRKTSGPRPPTANANKPRVRSGTGGMMIRPLSSSGPKNPINRPEGEAPWLASMYKPDPRLPPEQQMLPTHAKRLAQEGGVDVKTLDINDGAYTPPLDTQQHTLEPPHPEKQRLSPNGGSPTKSTHSKDNSAWPLGAGDAASEPSSPRPGTSGGYRITPVIASRPAPQKNSTSEKDITTPHNPTPRVPDFDKDEEEPPKKKGCMGCVVM
ncbi:hypothetical protein Q7P35_005709 [Cladosporium inversicolor]